MATIAFLGLGNMGLPMARNLLKAGHTVRAYDLVAAQLDAIRADGATVASDAADAARGADTVISMLPAGRHVEALYLGDGKQPGLLETLERGTLVIDCSTIAAVNARNVARAAEQRGFDMIDAPVSGGTGGAAAGTLTFIVGGGRQALERARPLLEVMGKNIFHAGDSGAGQIAKICNNMMLGIQMAGAAEALALGAANGLDPVVLSDIISRSSGRNWAFEVYNPWPGVMPDAPASKGYAGGFGSALMLKDLGLAAEAALASASAIPLGGLARNLYQMHCGSGNAALDFSSILNTYRKPKVSTSR